MLKVRKRYLVVFFCLLMVAVGAMHQHIFPFALKWLDIGQAPVPSKAVFVFFGNNDTRPFVAAALYNTGLAEEILMGFHNSMSSNKQEYSGQRIYKEVFAQRGVPEDRVHILGTHITNTMNESAVLLEYLEQNPEAIVTVVTSNYHTRRTRWSLRQNLGSHADRLHYVSAPEDDFTADDWWLYASGFEKVGMEYSKLVAYWIFYGRGGWWLAGLAGCFIAFFGYRWRRQECSDSSRSADAPVSAD